MKQFKTKRILVAILLAAAVLTDAKKGAPKDKDRPSEILLSPQDKELQEPTAAKKNKGKKSDPDFGQFSVVKNTLIEGEEDEVAFLKGQLELDDFEDLESLPTLKFKGLNQDKEKSTLVIHRVSQEHVSSPVIYRDASQAEQEEQDGLEEVGEIASVWYGEENGQGTGTASLMIDSKGNIFGSVSDGIKSFAISTFIDAESSAKIYQFEAFDLSDLPEEVEDGEFNNEDLGSAGDQRLLLSSPSLRGGFASPEDNMNNKTISRRLPPAVGTMVDVLVIYTSTAKNVAGGTSAMHNLIGLGMYQTNVAFANAGSDTRVRLVKTFEDTNFPDTSSNDAWSALKTNGDGHFDYVGSLRDQVGADVVMLIPQYLSGCGVAQFGGPYAAVKRQCATLNGQFSFAHEIGHLFVSITFDSCFFALCFL